jgi:hypothetical protein
MKIRLQFFLSALAVFASYGVAHASEENCEVLKSFFSETRPKDTQFTNAIKNLDLLIQKNDYCAKNLLGRVYYEGLNFTKDDSKAYAIFFDLSERNYPPTLFNLAFLLSKQKAADPEVTLTLLQGLVVNYTGHSENGHIARKARDLGRDYISNLEEARREAFQIEFEDVVKQATINSAVRIREKTDQRNENNDSLMGILALGSFTSSLSSRVKALAKPTNTVIYNSVQPQRYFAYPMGGNYLYLVPQ